MHRMIHNTRHLPQDTRAFTLIETLVAISVLLLVIIGPMTIAAKGLQQAFLANEQTTAVFLAQEAMEVVITLRDNEALTVLDEESQDPPITSGDTWDWYEGTSDFTSKCKNVNGCDFNKITGNFVTCTGDACNLKKNKNPGTGDVVYGHGAGSDWEDTPFTRVITLTDGGSGSGYVTVTVTVSWDSTLFSTPKTIVIQSWLYDHYSTFES